MKAPVGFVLNATPSNVELVYAGQEVSVTDAATAFCNDRQKIEISALKAMEQDETFGIGMNGEITAVSFGLYAKEEIIAADGTKIPADGLIEIAFCDAEGNVRFQSDVPFGRYYVTEVSTDPHYMLNGRVYSFEFVYKGQEVGTVTATLNEGKAIENKLIRGTIEGTKVDGEDKGLAGATFGLIAGSMMGGPLGKHLIKKKNLLDTVVSEDDSLLVEEEKKHERHVSMYPSAVFQLIIAMGIGTIVSKLLSLTGMTFPIYIGAMIVAAFIRNIGEYCGKFTIYMGEINYIGGISLSLFLGIAMITLKLWQLAALALPLLVLLAGQTILLFVYTNFIVFRVMGKDYDAAVLCAGVCGFGMGATPNAMANMQVLCEKYAPSVKAYLLVPLVGSLFADFINSLVITVFINFL